MAKLAMQKVLIAGHKKDRKGIMETLQKRGAVQLNTLQEQEGFSHIDTASQMRLFDSAAAAGRTALGILDEFAPQKRSMLASFEGRRPYTTEEFMQALRELPKAKSATEDLSALRKQITDCKTEIARLTVKMAELEPWLGLDLPLGASGTRHTRVLIGSVPYDASEDGLSVQLAQIAPELELYELELISSSPEQTCLVAVCHGSIASAFEGALRKLGFASVGQFHQETAQQRYDALHTRKTALEHSLPTLESFVRDLNCHRESIEVMVDYYTMRRDKYDAIGQLLHGNHTFLLEGYMPAKYADAILQELSEAYALTWELMEPDDDAPVMLENKAVFSPGNSVTAMYSLPSKDDVDPTPIMSVFFYLFFGMMFSDAGYGLLMVFATGFMLIKKNLERKQRENMKLFLFCGISTTLWGVVYGSFFGDLIPVVAEHFFDVTITIPALLDPVKDPMTLLIFGVALGAVQVFVGMGIKFYMLCRQGQVLDAIFDVGLWFLFVGGLLALIVGMVGGILIVGEIGKWSTIIGAVGVAATAGRNKRGAMKVFGGFGIGGLYDVMGYLSDILSYSRLMALGLATGVIASVMNLLGSMFGGGILGLIMFVIIFFLGHAVNFGINALGSYVHTIRLQYVEFFGKFYDGGGRPFEPLRINTKFIRFKEEKNDVNH